MLILALIISLILAIVSILRYKRVFNPFIIEVYFTVLFMIVPQLFVIGEDSGTDNFYSDLVIIVYISSIFIGTMINFREFRLKEIENVRIINSLNIVLYGLLVLPLVPFLLAAGISAQGFRQFYETVVFTKFASFYELSKLVLYFIIFFKLIKRQKFTLGFFILFPLVFVYGSRFVILDAIIYLCVFLEQFKNLGLKRIILTCFVGAVLIGVYTASQFTRDNMRDILVSYFDIYKNQSLVVNKLMNGEMEYFHGKLYFSSYLKFIPRILWEGKPKQFGFALLNYAILPEQAAAGYMPAFGLGTLFADFGFISVAFTGLMMGFIRNFFYRVLQVSKNNISFFLYIFPLAFITNVFLIFYLGLDYFLRKSKKPNVSIDPAPDNLIESK
jgi:hypothetical protein